MNGSIQICDHCGKRVDVIYSKNDPDYMDQLRGWMTVQARALDGTGEERRGDLCPACVPRVLEGTVRVNRG